MNTKITKALLIASLILNTFTIPVYYPEQSKNFKRDGLSLDIGIGDDEFAASAKTVPSDLLDTASTKTLPSKDLPSKSLTEDDKSTKTLPGKSLPTEAKSVPDVRVDSNNDRPSTKTLPCNIGIDLPTPGSKTIPSDAGSKTIPAPESKTVPSDAGSKTIPAPESKTIPPAAEPKTIPPAPASKTIPVDVPTGVKTIPVTVTPPSPTPIPPEQAEGGNSSSGGSDDSASISGVNVPVDDNNSEDEDNGADAAAGQADDIPNSSDIEYDDASGSNADAGSDDIPNSSDVESDVDTDTSNVQISTDNDQDVDVANVSPTTKTIPPAAEGPESPLPVPDTPAPENSEEEGIAGNSADAGSGNVSDEEGIAGNSADAGYEDGSEEENIDSADVLNSSDLEYDQIELKDENDIDENEAPVESPDSPASLPPKTLPNDTSSNPSAPSTPSVPLGVPSVPASSPGSSVEGQSTKDLPSSLPPKDLPTSSALDEEINIDIEVPFMDALGLELPGIGGEETKPSDNENVLNGDSGFTLPKPNVGDDKKDGAPIEAPDLKNPKDLSQSEYEDYLKDVNNNIESPLNFEAEDAAEDSAF